MGSQARNHSPGGFGAGSRFISRVQGCLDVRYFEFGGWNQLRGRMGIYWSTAAVLIAYFVLVWWIGTWLHLKGSDVWMLRGGLAFLGLLAAGIFLWFRHRLGAAASDGQQ